MSEEILNGGGFCFYDTPSMLLLRRYVKLTYITFTAQSTLRHPYLYSRTLHPRSIAHSSAGHTFTCASCISTNTHGTTYGPESSTRSGVGSDRDRRQTLFTRV